jgi:hypothetical protein
MTFLALTKQYLVVYQPQVVLVWLLSQFKYTAFFRDLACFSIDRPVASLCTKGCAPSRCYSKQNHNAQ